MSGVTTTAALRLGAVQADAQKGTQIPLRVGVEFADDRGGGLEALSRQTANRPASPQMATDGMPWWLKW